MRLGDLDALQKEFEELARIVAYCDRERERDAAARVKCASTIDPETLPIVKELRAENKKLTEALGDSFALDLMNKLDKVEKERDEMAKHLDIATQAISDYIGLATKMEEERDAAIEQLHGYCPACKNYIENHCEGPYEGCKHEYCVYDGYDAQDYWEWHGPVKE